MVKYNWLKLPSIASYRRNGNFTRNRDNSWHLHWIIRDYLQLILSKRTEEERKRRAFFRWQDQYREHSRDLGNALYEWWKGQKLSYCEYENGHYVPHAYLRIQPADIINLKFAIAHMNRSHPEVESRLNEVERRNDESCREIIQLMVYRYADSFETIIVKAIRTRCPSLKKEDDEQKLVNSDNKNGYVDHLVFKLIFNGVDDELSKSKIAKEIQIRPLTDSHKENNRAYYYKLQYQNDFLAMANQEQILSTLKQTIIDLFSDSRLEQIVDGYYRTFNEQEGKMHDVKRLADQWYAGKLELPDENYPVCDGCPAKPDDVEER